MGTKTKYRNNGAVGALLDEYEKALNELIEIIKKVSPHELKKIIDPFTKDEDCRSIQTILTHVVQSGYTYVIEIRKWLGESVSYKDKVFLETAGEYERALSAMFEFNETLFFDYPNLPLFEKDADKKINVRWGQKYDVEQLFEHAIVHILRHRRQIEKFIKMDTKTITVEITIKAPMEKVWACWTTPEHITQWNFASEEWTCPSATNDLRPGGIFNWRMDAKDGSMGFDFMGTYEQVKDKELITYNMSDGRKVMIQFTNVEEGVKLSETFEAEGTNADEQQRAGWQAILENFRNYVESN